MSGKTKHETAPIVGENCRGATMLEYAFLASLIAMVALGSLGFVGDTTRGVMYTSANAMNGNTTEDVVTASSAVYSSSYPTSTQGNNASIGVD